MIQDIRFAYRTLLKVPGFALIAILTLALAIGANTAVFSVADAVLLRPLPFPDADRLVQISSVYRNATDPGDSVSYPNYADWRQRAHSFEQMAAFHYRLVDLSGDGQRPEALMGIAATWTLWPALKVQPMLGRAFLPAEDRPGKSDVAVLSFDLWKRRYAQDREIVGKTIWIGRRPHVVVGVMPAGFNFPMTLPTADNGISRQMGLWVPLAIDAASQFRGGRGFGVVARLRKGATVGQARGEIASIGADLAREYPTTNRDLETRVCVLKNQLTGDIRPGLTMLTVAIGLVLLIACVNIANLLLARATGRARESAIRAALGATRADLARQSLAESALLALAGAAIGIPLASWGLAILLSFAPRNIPRLREAAIDWRVAAFGFAVMTVTALLCGAAPAWRAARRDVDEALKAGGGRTTGDGGRLGSAMIAGQIALSAMLLTGAGLLIHSFSKLGRVDPGFRPERVLSAWVMPPPGHDAAYQLDFFDKLLRRAAELPGVEAAGADSGVPLSGINNYGPVRVAGTPAPHPGEAGPDALQHATTPGYLKAMGIGVLRGRGFAESDNEKAPAVAIVNETAARRFWPGRDPLGKRLIFDSIDGETGWRTVVGVVRDVHYYGLDLPPRAEVYAPHGQLGGIRMVALRGRSSTAGLEAELRRIVGELDPEQPLFNVRTMEDLVADSKSRRRFQMLLLAVFAATALLLAAAGVHGVTAYFVARRTREMGVRAALGASPANLLRLVLGRGLRVAAAGSLLGALGALAAGRLIESLLFGVSSADPLALVATPGLLLVVALAACWLPARKASKVDPMVALRYE